MKTMNAFLTTSLTISIFSACNTLSPSEVKSADASNVVISSEVGKERKKDITVEQAAGILRDVRRSGSSILVGIVAHGVPLQAYLPLLKEISDNQLLELVFVERQEFGFINKNIKKIIEQDSADQPATAPESKPEGKEKTEPESEGRSQ